MIVMTQLLLGFYSYGSGEFDFNLQTVHKQNRIICGFAADSNSKSCSDCKLIEYNLSCDGILGPILWL